MSRLLRANPRTSTPPQAYSTAGTAASASCSSGEEDAACPLCLEDMDASDCRFKPCPCGYQVSTLLECWPLTIFEDLPLLLAPDKGGGQREVSGVSPHLHRRGY